MKFFVVFALVAAVASATIIPAGHPAAESPEIQEIIAAINSPNTDPATAILLEQMLQDLLGLNKPEYEPVHVEPALIDEDSPSLIEMPVIDFPVGADGQAIVPSPVDVPAVASSPLVQIIVNVNNQTPGGPNPVQVVDGAEVAPTPVEVVDEAVNDYEPVLVMDPFPVVPEPVVVAPIVVPPIVVAPDTIN